MSRTTPSDAPRSARRFVFVVEPPDGGRRLDTYLAEQLPHLSRTRIQTLIAAGSVAIGGPAPRTVRASDRVRPGDRIEVDVPPPEPAALRPEPIPLEVVHEDEDVLVINKPAGLTVHPGAGRPSGTLVHAVLAHCPDLPGIGGEQRPGIVHRLDKDTSGLLVVAKTEAALRHLQAEIQSRRARRDYLALVHGRVAREEGIIDAPIGRDPRHRTRMAVVATGRRAVTFYRVREGYPRATLLEVRLETGRTHQIRVHCASLGHPVVGDPVYGRRPNPWGLRRQALHAYRLTFVHPSSGRELTLTVPLPADIDAALQALRAEAAASGRRR
ncbi:MAG: RluA family pseudouridine synthase [Armatimonadetes bacterium]|nr:RluA family pseudouridine synthase [Armatimonadota bacterium]